MRLKNSRPNTRFALTAIVAIAATTVALAFGAGVTLAADYQDANHNRFQGDPPAVSFRGCQRATAKFVAGVVPLVAAGLD